MVVESPGLKAGSSSVCCLGTRAEPTCVRSFLLIPKITTIDSYASNPLPKTRANPRTLSGSAERPNMQAPVHKHKIPQANRTARRRPIDIYASTERIILGRFQSEYQEGKNYANDRTLVRTSVKPKNQSYVENDRVKPKSTVRPREASG